MDGWIDIDRYTMWGLQVIRWFITPCSYSHHYHKPKRENVVTDCYGMFPIVITTIHKPKREIVVMFPN